MEYLLKSAIMQIQKAVVSGRLRVSKVPYRKKKSRHKISSVKYFLTGKIIRHFLPTNFFAWLSENINGIKKTLISYLDYLDYIILLSFKSFNQI